MGANPIFNGIKPSLFPFNLVLLSDSYNGSKKTNYWETLLPIHFGVNMLDQAIQCYLLLKKGVTFNWFSIGFRV